MSEFWQVLMTYHWLASLLIVTGSLVAAWAVDYTFGHGIKRLTRHTKTDLDDKLAGALRFPVYGTVALTGLWLSFKPLLLSDSVDEILLRIFESLLLVLWGLAITRLIQVATEAYNRKLAHHHGMVDADLIGFLDRLVQIGVITVVGLIVLSLWGLNVGPLMASAGVAGVAVAFAAKDLIGNLFGGLSVFMDRPYRAGDYVIVQDKHRGEVMEIGMRSTKIRTRDNVLVTVPNSVMVTDAVINETGFDPKLRIRLPLSVAYGSDLEKVERVLVDTAVNMKEILHKPVPIVRYRSFGESGIELELLAVINEPMNRGRILHLLIKEIDKVFKKQKIVIPFPQRDVHVIEKKKGMK